MKKHNYGYYFNSVEVKDNVVVKTAKNDYGKPKINNEIKFYNYIISNNVHFPMPKLIFSDIDISSFQIEFLDKHQTMCDVFYNESAEKSKHFENTKLINTVLTHINKLHSHESIYVSKNEYLTELNIETNQKVIDRYNATKWNNIEIISEITHVNGIKIHDVYYYIEKINEYLEHIVSNLNVYCFTLIHGDIHLGNIMMDGDGDIRFIDPRGYFGNMSLFGIKEYDFAKLIFGLSGYSVFDKMTFSDIKITNGNMEIPFIENHLHIYESDIFSEYAKLLSLTIWLSNNSMYLDNSKKIYSLMISYYLCEIYLRKYNFM
jgi:hypothetical protein